MNTPENNLDEKQYQILQDRIWKYNDLLWKNFLTYGGVLSVFSGFVLDWKSDEKIRYFAFHLTICFILFILAFIQKALNSRLEDNVNNANSIEKKNSWRIITKTKEDLKTEDSPSVQRAYGFAEIGMIIIPIILIVVLFFPVFHLPPIPKEQMIGLFSGISIVDWLTGASLFFGILGTLIIIKGELNTSAARIKQSWKSVKTSWEKKTPSLLEKFTCYLAKFFGSSHPLETEDYTIPSFITMFWGFFSLFIGFIFQIIGFLIRIGVFTR